MQFFSSHTFLQRLSLALLLGAMTAIFVTALPHLNVDRVSENCYMGNVYKMILQEHPRIYQQDPFLENGPHAVFTSGYIAHHFNSLKLMRYYHFLYSLLIMAMMYFLFFYFTGSDSLARWEIPILAVLMITVWLSIPLSLIYPIQFNGMIPGFACLLLGLWLNEKHPFWAMLSFGFAYTFKGQFLAMMPGILAYKFVFEKGTRSWGMHVGQVALSLIIFFLPASLILPTLFWWLGLFDNRADLFAYAFKAQGILWEEFSYIFPRLANKVAVDTQGAAIRAKEYAGFGILAWALIATSILFCFTMIGVAIYRLAKRIPTSASSALSIFGLAGLGYWCNYLFFWRFPFWYDVLPVVLFNIVAIPLIVFWIRRQIQDRWGTRPAMAFILVITLLFGRHFYRRLWVNPLWDRSIAGDSLKFYDWMAPKA